LVERNHGLGLALAVDVSDDVHHGTRLHLNASMEGRRGRRKEGRTQVVITTLLTEPPTHTFSLKPSLFLCHQCTHQ
jgi:hypothetical protein